MTQTTTIRILLTLFTLGLVWPTTPTYAGEPPGGVIGPMNPTMFKCINKDGKELYQPDPFNKLLASRINPGGEIIEFDEDFDGGYALMSEEFREDNPDANQQTCSSPMDIAWGFDPTNSGEFNAYLADLESTCNDKGGKIVPIEDTRIEGFVYEFHQNAAGEWFSVPSRDVPVVATGITFNVEWGSTEEGYYRFHNLGAGPIVLNLRLPPDAHPVNPNAVVYSSGLDETWTVFMGFYRGNNQPADVSQLTTPNGNFLPFSNPRDVEVLRQCGYLGTPTGGNFPTEIYDFSLGLPSVGGNPASSVSPMIWLSAIGTILLLIGAGWVRATDMPEERSGVS